MCAAESLSVLQLTGQAHMQQQLGPEMLSMSVMHMYQLQVTLQLCCAHLAAGWRLAAPAHISHSVCAAKAGVTAMHA